jgi:DNA (cytosine-5)-methyltransferase 1
MIQTFPKNFVLVGSKTDKEQLVGNAVPVNMAKLVAESIKKYVSNNHNSLSEIKPAFIKWLIDDKILKEKSAKDVYSRLNRASKFIDLNFSKDIDDLMFMLIKQPNFKELSGDIKSQLRRSIKFYKEFKDVIE